MPKPVNKPDDVATRQKLACDTATQPDMLLVLADDADASVRKHVAENPAAPVKAQVLLALDKEENVRTALAARAASLVPKLAQAGITHAEALATHVLELLAIDKASNVRQALASSLKDVAMTPAHVARKLAEDIVREVAQPILRYCLALSDDDLVAIIAGRPDGWQQEEIAQRPKLSEKVSDAIITNGNEKAIVTLLDNSGAVISEPSLSRLVEQSAGSKTLQEPLARRPKLPPRLAMRMVEFVEENVLLALRQRRDYDAGTAQDIIEVVRRRIGWVEMAKEGESGNTRARRMFLAGALDETQISDGMSWNEEEFVVAGLACLSAVKPEIIRDIFKSQSPRGITALAWRAGLSMRCAIQLQSRMGNVPANKLLNARGGTQYPLTEVEMIWQLEFFGAKA